jgi:FAD/FMN-containing dehydrogenase
MLISKPQTFHTFNMMTTIKTPLFLLVALSTISCHAIYSKCGFSSSIRHDTWYDQTFTNSPVLFPTNDEELCTIVSTAKKNGCKVRVRGAGHSEDGLVMQKLDELGDADIVVVHLKDYTPTDSATDGSTGASWNGFLLEEQSTVKVPTGWSTLELMALIRPQGYLTRTNTAGRIFSVGGAYLNPSVNGNVIEESRYAAQVQSVRTMDAECNVNVFSGQDVKDWRGSAGLLGIVTAVEISVVKDSGLTMTRSAISTRSYDKSAVRSWIADEYNNHDAVELFYWVYEDVIDALEVDYNGGIPLTPPSLTQAYYEEEMRKNPDASYSGGYASGLAQFSEVVAGIIELDKNIGHLVQKVARETQNRLFDQAAQMPRDGYFLEPDEIPNFNVITSNIKCATDCVDESTEILDISRQFLQQIVNDSNSNWYPNLPLEWRVYTVQPDEMTLEHLEPGKYVSFDLLALRVGADGLASSRFLKSLQEKWYEMYPNAAIHHGKGYGYQNIVGYGSSEDAVQYQNDVILDSVYNGSVRVAFQEKMKLYDPTGTFAAGSFLRLLGLSDIKFTPKQYNGDKCFDFGDHDCISDCCGTTFFSSVNNVCVMGESKTLNEACSAPCECIPGLKCDWGPWPWEWSYACRE